MYLGGSSLAKREVEQNGSCLYSHPRDREYALTILIFPELKVGFCGSAAHGICYIRERAFEYYA